MTLTVLSNSNIIVNNFVDNCLKFAIDYDCAWDSVPIRIFLLIELELVSLDGGKP
jgi:hypothetical protein